MFPYAGSGNAGAPVRIRLYGDIGEGRTEKWTEQSPQFFHL